MGLIILAEGVSGGTVGVQLVHYLRAVGNFEFVMKLVYVIMLGTIGGSMFVESLRALRKVQSMESFDMYQEEMKQHTFVASKFGFF